MKKSDLSAFLFLLLSIPVFAQPEFLDHGFGNAGRQVLTRPGYDQVRNVIVQPDGKIIVAGTSLESSTYRYSLVRYNPDGSLDTGFGQDGKNHTFYIPGDVTGYVYDVALQPDGKIVALGNYSTQFGGNHYGLVRYLSNGHPDVSFAFPDVEYLNYLTALTVTTDGKILLAGGKYSGAGHFMVSRFNPDGVKDGYFGAGGVVVLDFGTKVEIATDVAVQPDGKILATGYYDNDLVLVRLNVSGTSDSSFNSTGHLLIDGGYSGKFLFIRPDGKIIVGATGLNGISLFRVNPNGSLDDTFGATGEVKVPGFGKYGSVTDLEMRPDGGFWAACTDNSGKDVIIKLTQEGVLDTGFANAGILYTTPELHFLAPQADSAFVVATTTVGGDFDLRRYLPTGDFDPAFHQGTPVINNIAQSGGNINALAVQPDGKIIGVGEKYCCGQAMVRLNGDGAPDSSFLAQTTFLNNTNGALHALFQQPDGKIVTGGGIVYALDDGIHSTEGVLYRFLPDGTLDTTFSNKAVTYIKALARQPDGRFLAAGTDEGKMGHFSYVRPRLVRYLADGAVDSSFGAGGIVTHPCRCDLLALQPDGKILVAGGKEPDSFMVIRYGNEGAPDPAFGTNGYIQEPGSVDLMTLLPDGKILLAENTDDGLTLSRYQADGAPDVGFGVGGKRLLAMKPYDNIHAMGLQADGKIVLAGEGENGQSGFDFLLARLLPDGSPDTTVGLGGTVYTDFGDVSALDFATALAIQPDGKIILGGLSSDYSGAYEAYKFAVARYRADLSVEAKEVYGPRFSPLKIAPNPVAGFFTVQLPEPGVQPLEISVFDSQGRFVKRVFAAAGEAIEAGSLPPGTYTVKAVDGGRAFLGKIVKQ